jgi:molecular chaperone GrpE
MKRGPVSELKERLERAEDDARKFYDSYLRALAALDNYRKQKDEEMKRNRDRIYEEVMLALIPVFENFERALSSTEVTGDYESLFKGIEIIFRQFKECLTKFGVVDYSAKGKPFDPRYHEAVSVVETEDYPPDTVVDEISKGYMFKDRVIKPAVVTVAKPKGGGKDG